jgi:BON domain
MATANILEKINKTLVEDPRIDEHNIWVNVEDGHVTLAGSVAEPDLVVAAETAVVNIDGVQDVVSLLCVESESHEIHVSDPPPSPKDPKHQLTIQVSEMVSEGGIAF